MTLSNDELTVLLMYGLMVLFLGYQLIINMEAYFDIRFQLKPQVDYLKQQLHHYALPVDLSFCGNSAKPLLRPINGLPFQLTNQSTDSITIDWHKSYFLLQSPASNKTLKMAVLNNSKPGDPPLSRSLVEAGKTLKLSLAFHCVTVIATSHQKAIADSADVLRKILTDAGTANLVLHLSLNCQSAQVNSNQELICLIEITPTPWQKELPWNYAAALWGKRVNH